MRLENGKVVMTRREFDEVLAKLTDRRLHLAEYEGAPKVLFCLYHKDEGEGLCVKYPMEVVDDGKV
ncbi:MAG: hypothetical protein C0167_00405 [Nitrososphaera sp.]|nr:MAG: hypothetical protein C0167_00405 [Nitrososphaera sp.]